MIVAKDNGAAKVTVPVAQILKKHNHDLIVVVEGWAAERYFEAGVKMDFQGTRDFVRQPFSLDCKSYLEWSKPDIIVTGISGPINLEQGFGLAANAADIPLVVVQDFWGTFVRNAAQADALCVLDEFDANLAKKASQRHITISGNGGAQTVEVPQALLAEVEALKQSFGYVYTYIGGSEINTDDELLLVIECLKKNPGCLIPRFHPNHVNLPHPKGGTWGEHWWKTLEVLGDRSVRIRALASTDQVAVASDLVISGFSTVLTTAAYNGTPIALSRTEETMEDFFACTKGLDEIPHIRLGAPVFTEPMDLRNLRKPIFGIREKFIPFDPRKVIKAVELLLAERALLAPTKHIRA